MPSYQPRQARSRERVQRILAAADEILATDGFEALTIRRLARQAGVPVGSIYQFFSDKSAVVDALARHYMDGFEELMEELVEGAADAEWADLTDAVFDAFVEMYRARPGYVALWRGRHLSPELMRADDANNALLAQGLRRIVVARTGQPDDARTALACEVAVHVGDALLQLAFRRNPHGDPAVINEAKRIQRLYLQDLLPTGRLG
jgi:AcrR family transcriptional regulator